MLPPRFRRSAGPLAIALLALASLSATPAAAANPAGNNGTVKIDGVAFERHPNNEPHVGCIFEVDFYGFDLGVGNAQVIFEAHEPTGSGVLATRLVDIGQDDNAGGGSEAGWDASVAVDLTDALAAYPVHPQQGKHVKLTVHAPGSQGADVKHKVFWVQGCDPSIVPPSNPPSTPPSNRPSPSGGTDGNSGEPPREGTQGGSGGPGQMLPDTSTGTNLGSVALLGAVLLGSSAGLAVATVRRHRRPGR